MKASASSKALYAIILANLILMWPAWDSLISLWIKPDTHYSYGLPAVLACLYYLNKLLTLNTNSSSPAQHPILSLALWLALLLTSLLWVITELLQLKVGSQLIMVISLSLAIGSIFGPQKMYKSLPALFFLALSIPVWDYLNSSLQTLTTTAVSVALELSNLPVFIEGNYISIPQGTFEVAGGCSGLRYLLVSLVLVNFYSVQYLSHARIKLAAFAIVGSLSICANWLRVLGLVMIGYHSDMQSSLVNDHETYGWVVYFIVMLPAFLMSRRLPNVTPNDNKTTRHHSLTLNNARVKALSKGAIITTLLALCSGPLLSIAIHNSIQNQQHSLYEWGATPPKGWTSAKPRLTSWQLGYPGAQNYQSLAFYKHQTAKLVEIRSAFYSLEEQGSELVNLENYIFDTQKWTKQPPLDNPIQPDSRKVNVDIYSHGTKRFISMSFYQIGSKTSQGGIVTKLDQLGAIFSPNEAKSFTAFSTECTRSCQEEAELLSEFIDNFLDLNQAIVKEK